MPRKVAGSTASDPQTLSPRVSSPRSSSKPQYQPQESKDNAILHTLVALAVAPTVVFLILELNPKLLLAANFRLYNAVDLTLNTVFYYVIFARLKMLVLRTESASIAEYFVGFLELAFQSGRVMHGTADVIHTLYTETKPRLIGLVKIAPEVHELIYFLDEDLGHWLTFLPLHGLLALLCVLHRSSVNTRISDSRRLFCFGAGGLMGLTHAVAVIEGSHPWLGLAGTCMLMIGCWLSTLHSTPSAEEVRLLIRGSRTSVFTIFNFGLAVGILGGLMLYRIAVGSFQEPSELGGVIAVAKGVLRCLFTAGSLALNC